MYEEPHCWECNAALPAEADACPACGALQPVPGGADHFAVMGIAPRAVLDNAELERRFHALSRRYHPDKFVSKTAQERRISEQRAAALNAAYRTLRDPLSRAQYLLERAGKEVTAESKQVPPELAEALFAIQEKIMEFTTADGDDRERLQRELADEQAKLDDEREALARTVVDVLQRWDAEDAERNSDVQAALLDALEKAIARRSYLSTMVRDITNAGAR